MNRTISFLALLLIIFMKAQKSEFISIGKDAYGNSLSYKMDKTLDNEFFYWFKIEYTLENDPGISKTEYYINSKCDNKSSAMLKYANDWRKDDEDDKFYEASKNQIKYIVASKNDKTYFLFKKYCEK